MTIKIKLAIICLSTIANLSAQNHLNFPVQKINLNSLPELIEGNWEYDYSFNIDSTFEMTGDHIQAHYVPYRIEFNKTSDKQDKKY